MESISKKSFVMIVIALAIAIAAVYIVASNVGEKTEVSSVPTPMQQTDHSSEALVTPSNPAPYESPETTIKFEQRGHVENKKTTLVKLRDDGRRVFYSGAITVSGKYQEYPPETMMGGELCFYADEKTGYLIPRDPNLRGAGGEGDGRIPWFCFNDQEKVKKLFGVDDKAIFRDKKIECIQGEATVEVSNYVVDKLESEVFDTADLDKIISKGKYSTQCN